MYSPSSAPMTASIAPVVGGWGGSATGLSNVDGSAAIENETTGHFEFKPDQWYQVRLRVTKKQIQAWVDKEELIDLAREGHRFSIWWEQEPARPLGIATWQTKAGLKEIRLRPKIGEHDVEYKIRKAREFLQDGDKVQLNMIFKGREMAHIDVGRDVMNDFVKGLEDIAKIERPAKLEGKRMTMVLTKA